MKTINITIFSFLLTFNISLNMPLTADELKLSESEVFSGESKNKDKDKTTDYLSYLITLYKNNVISLENLKKHLHEIKNGVFDNPIKCTAQNCKNSTQIIHHKELQKYFNKKNNINLNSLETKLSLFLNEIDEVQNIKIDVVDDKQRMDDFIPFHTVGKDKEYVQFRQLEEIPSEKIKKEDKNQNNEADKETFLGTVKQLMSFLPYFKDKYYGFKRMKLTEEFELAEIPVTQSFFAKIMGFNPSYVEMDANSMYPYIDNNIKFTEILNNGNSVKVKLGVAVYNVMINDSFEFLKKLNERPIKSNLVLKLNQGKDCYYNFLSSKQADYLMYQQLKNTTYLEDGKVNKLEDINFNSGKIEIQYIEFLEISRSIQRKDLKEEFFRSHIIVRTHHSSKKSEEREIYIIPNLDFEKYYQKNHQRIKKEYKFWDEPVLNIEGNNFYQLLGTTNIQILEKEKIVTFFGYFLPLDTKLFSKLFRKFLFGYSSKDRVQSYILNSKETYYNYIPANDTEFSSTKQPFNTLRLVRKCNTK